MVDSPRFLDALGSYFLLPLEIDAHQHPVSYMFAHGAIERLINS